MRFQLAPASCWRSRRSSLAPAGSFSPARRRSGSAGAVHGGLRSTRSWRCRLPCARSGRRAQRRERHDRLCQSLRISGWHRLRLIDWPLLRRPLLTALAFAMALSLGDLGVIALFGSDAVVDPALSAAGQAWAATAPLTRLVWRCISGAVPRCWWRRRPAGKETRDGRLKAAAVAARQGALSAMARRMHFDVAIRGRRIRRRHGTSGSGKIDAAQSDRRLRAAVSRPVLIGGTM